MRKDGSAKLNKLKNILIKLITVLYGVICVPITFGLLFYVGIITITNLFETNILLTIGFSMFSIAAIISLWLFAFKKIKMWVQLIIFIIVAIYFYGSLQFPVVQKGIDVNMCMDMGVCAEGIKFSDGIMTEEYCEENNYIWNDEKKYCDMRSKD